MYKQTEEKYRKIKLGFGTRSLYDFGCYLFALNDGLIARGYNFTPVEFNDELKKRNAFTGEFKNYINDINMKDLWSEIFKGFQRIDPWDDMKQLKTLLDAGKIVLGRVDARGIGGTGTHFVRISRIEGANAIIRDPWFGDEIPVASRYNAFDNILGLRVYDVVIKNNIPLFDPEEDIPTEVEESLELKSTYKSWYNKSWSWKALVEWVNDLWDRCRGLESRLEAVTEERDQIVERVLTAEEKMNQAINLAKDWEERMSKALKERDDTVSQFDKLKGIIQKQQTQLEEYDKTTKIFIKEVEKLRKKDYTVGDAIKILIKSLYPS